MGGGAARTMMAKRWSKHRAPSVGYQSCVIGEEFVAQESVASSLIVEQILWQVRTPRKGEKII
jgi:hypothetical protein